MLIRFDGRKKGAMIKICAAGRCRANAIAGLIMQAMSYDCCRYFVGPGYTLDDFERIMTSLVSAETSQYSYTNTMTAEDREGAVCGICVSYDGGRLHTLRKAFVQAMKECCGRDFSRMDDETSAGELYIDSLAVREDCRGKGIATALLKAAVEKAEKAGLPAVGLLVDKENCRAERLYKRAGFVYVNDAVWGGHPMKHLQYKIAFGPAK